MFALGAAELALRPARPSRRWSSSGASSARSPTIAGGQHRRAQGRLQLRRDHRGLRASATRSRPATMPPGTYRNITGNLALALGLVAAGQLGRAAALPRHLPDHAGLATSCTSCRKHKNFGVTHVPGRGRDRRRSARRIGAAFGGALGVTTTPARAWRSRAEAIGLAVMTELPLVIIDIQRGGPVDRPAHQDGAGRPAAGDVRPQRRGAAAGHRRAGRRRDCFDTAWRRRASPSGT